MKLKNQATLFRFMRYVCMGGDAYTSINGKFSIFSLFQFWNIFAA